MFCRKKIRSHERGLLFKDREFQRVLGRGTHMFLGLHYRVEVFTIVNPWLVHKDLALMYRNGSFQENVTVVDLKDHERALVWIDGRFDAVLGPGLHALWKGLREVRVEVVDSRTVRFEHEELAVMVSSPGAEKLLHHFVVEDGHVGFYCRDGHPGEPLPPGSYAFWKDGAQVKWIPVDTRESVVDISGQEIMTADKVTLRVNALVTCRVTDSLRSITVVDDARQALYREAQLTLRAAIGARELDALLVEKDAVCREWGEALKERAGALGISLVSLGLRDIILPGDMRDLLNKVMEAKKAAEASLITRREETAAMRSQANTAKILENNPTLMRLRELEALEKVADKGKLNVVVAEKGLAEKIVNLI